MLRGQGSAEEAELRRQVEGLLARAEEAETREAAVDAVAQALLMGLVFEMKATRMSMRAKRIAKPERAAAVLRACGLDRLLVEGWVRGRVTTTAADRQLAQMRDALATRRCAPEDLKYGILAFDGFAQRMAAADSDGTFAYTLKENRARDLLLTFARALHR
ncbi:MAG: hypothetical protein IPK13_17690 [Deltaproteobacteria bacterium]|nr:hypothetical protein [Deltaproteobacteria bacterium]